MVSVAEALSWRPDRLARLARVLRSGARALAESADDSYRVLAGIPDNDFAGTNRLAAEDAVERSATGLRRSGVAFERLADCCSDSAALLSDAVSELNSAVTWATSLGFQVDLATGAVTLGGLGVLRGAGSGATGAVGPVTVARWRVDAERRIHASLARLESLDAKVADAIAALIPLQFQSGPTGAAGMPSSAEGLTESATSADAAAATPLAGVDRDLAERARSLGLAGPELLESSPLHSAIAFGDVQRAQTVITLVPGTGSSADDAARQLERVAATFTASGENPEDVAVVLFSYDAPQNLYAATNPEYYDFAAERLQHLQAGLVERAAASNGETTTSSATAAVPSQRHVVAGYSYGATVVSQATVGSGLYADRVLLVASPGVGPGIEQASQMKLLRPDGTVRPGHENSHRVAVATSPVDPIRVPAAFRVHKKNPADEDFGAYRIDMAEHSVSSKEVAEFLTTPIRQLPEKYGHRMGNPHTEHYFDDDIFTRETSRWLQAKNATARR